MSAVSESMNRRMTLGLLASRYGFDLDPAFATEVTVTSIADDIDSVRPGALFMPSMQVDEQQLRQGRLVRMVRWCRMRCEEKRMVFRFL